jgi:hypothetical protein
MTWTTPGTAVTNTVITSAFWNTNIRDDLNAIYNNIWTKISILSGDSTNPIVFSSIPQIYSHLKFVGMLRSTIVATADSLIILANAISNYYHEEFMVDGAGTYSFAGAAANATIHLTSAINGSTAPANTYSSFEMIISKYSSTIYFKSFLARITRRIAATAITDFLDINSSGWINAAPAITQVSFDGSSRIDSISNITMYGMP